MVTVRVSVSVSKSLSVMVSVMVCWPRGSSTMAVWADAIVELEIDQSYVVMVPSESEDAEPSRLTNAAPSPSVSLIVISAPALAVGGVAAKVEHDCTIVIAIASEMISLWIIWSCLVLNSCQ